ncbi:MAG: hypothetical protein ACOCWL_01685 [Thermoguttaceae bacterium]
MNSQPSTIAALRRGRFHDRRALAWSALVVYVLLLGVVGLVRQAGGGGAGPPALQLRWLFAPEEWLVQAGLAGLGQLAMFAMLGFLVHLAVFLPGSGTGEAKAPTVRTAKHSGAEPTAKASGSGVAHRWRRRLLAPALGVGLAVLLAGWPFGGGRSVYALLAPVGGVLLGGAVARSWLAGWWAVLRLAGMLAAAVVLLLAATAVLAYLALDNAPLPFEPLQVTPTDKRRLARQVGGSERIAGNRQRLRLSQRDVEQLLAVAMDHAPLEGKARAKLGEGTVAVEGSVRVPLRVLRGKYLNGNGEFRVGVESGRLHLVPLRLQVGRLPIPGLLLRLLGRVAVAAVHADPYAKEALASIERVRVGPDEVDATYQPGQLRGDLLAGLRAHLGEPEEVVEATAVYYRHLTAWADPLPRGDEGFITAVSTAFALAEKRSGRGDPVTENRAAILALAILLGHPRVESFVGSIGDAELRRPARVYLQRARLRGRRDWVQHFFVSAGLAVLSSPAASDGVGLLKEEIDAGPGGTGFSFADLLADRAGTEFAHTATRNAAAARRMQQRLAGGFAIGDVFPPADGLPEGISDARLQAEYGGVGGPKFRAVLDDIERRLTTCAALEQSLRETP